MAIKILDVKQTSKAFIEACGKVGIPPTRRQWKKWQKKVGLAWEKRNE